MARKTFGLPPEQNFEHRTDITVGNMCRTFETQHGPQRNRPADSRRWRSQLVNRARRYGSYNPVLVRPRIASERGDGNYYPLDGNGSNFWYMALFGPQFTPPSGTFVVDLRNPDGTPDYAAENRLMQDVQIAKNMTRTEAFTNDREFNARSDAYKINKAVEKAGFYVSQRTMDARSIGSSVAEKIRKLYGEAAITEALLVVREKFPSPADSLEIILGNEDVPADQREAHKQAAEKYKRASRQMYQRTNGSFVIAVANMLNSRDYDRARVLRALERVDLPRVAEGARGAGAEAIVIPRLRELYDAA